MPDFAEKPVRIENRILAVLPAKECARLDSHLERVTLKAGQVLYEPGGAMRYGYFLDTALVAMLTVAEGGETFEVNLVANEGVVGIPIFLRSDTMPYRVLVQSAGTARRIKAELLRREFDSCGPLHDLLMRYLHVLFIQISQAGFCNRFHSVGQRLAVWLLVNQDRAQSDELRFTQGFLSQMLGVNPGTVSEAAGALRKRGLIRYSRGHITVVDRPGLQAAACGCYGVVKQESDRFFLK
jgi:CRP-like cAMP-binding protein